MAPKEAKAAKKKKTKEEIEEEKRLAEEAARLEELGEHAREAPCERCAEQAP